MTQHNHTHSGSEKHKHRHKEKTGIRNLHKDWRTWVAVGLMLTAIAMYVLTLDDSVVPVVQTGNQGQAATTTMPSSP
jgi:ABC-type nickel/cobalt efflux system permease component RcnA